MNTNIKKCKLLSEAMFFKHLDHIFYPVVYITHKSDHSLFSKGKKNSTHF